MTFYTRIILYVFLLCQCKIYCYANDVDYDLGNKYLEAYYGDHLERLVQIKSKYDPNNLFHWKQSIPLSK